MSIPWAPDLEIYQHVVIYTPENPYVSVLFLVAVCTVFCCCYWYHISLLSAHLFFWQWLQWQPPAWLPQVQYTQSTIPQLVVPQEVLGMLNNAVCVACLTVGPVDKMIADAQHGQTNNNSITLQMWPLTSTEATKTTQVLSIKQDNNKIIFFFVHNTAFHYFSTPIVISIITPAHVYVHCWRWRTWCMW